MAKILLYILIVVISSSAGYLVTRSYKLRVQNLDDLITALHILEVEIRYHKDPLSVIASKIEQLKLGLASKLFGKLVSNGSNSNHIDFKESWQRSISDVYLGTSLKDPDIRILEEIGGELGRTDSLGQSSMFHRAYQLLDQQIQEAKAIQVAKTRIVQSAATAGGILLVIMLL